MTHKVQNLKTSLRAALREFDLPSHKLFFVNNNGIDLQATRKNINDFWNKFGQSEKKPNIDITMDKIDTILVLTSEEVFRNDGGYDGEYGLSGLGGACGYGEK